MQRSEIFHFPYNFFSNHLRGGSPCEGSHGETIYITEATAMTSLPHVVCCPKEKLMTANNQAPDVDYKHMWRRAITDGTWRQFKTFWRNQVTGNSQIFIPAPIVGCQWTTTMEIPQEPSFWPAPPPPSPSLWVVCCSIGHTTIQLEWALQAVTPHFLDYFSRVTPNRLPNVETEWL